MSDYSYLSSRAVIGMFFESYALATKASWVADLANQFSSDQSIEEYPWLGANSRMSEVKGGSQVHGHNQFKIAVPNKHYDNVLVIDEKDMRRDKTDQIETRVGELADEAANFDEYQVSDLIVDGEASICYSGQYFYDTDHVVKDSGTQSNIVTVDISELPTIVHGSSAAAPSPEEIQQAVTQGITRLMSLKNDKGYPENRGAKEFTVMLPFGLWSQMFNQAVMPATAGVSVQRPDVSGHFKVTYELNHELAAWSDQFVIFRSDARTKAFIVQEETAVRMQLEQTPQSDNGYQYRWSVDTWRGYGYGRWERSVLVKMV